MADSAASITRQVVILVLLVGWLLYKSRRGGVTVGTRVIAAGIVLLVAASATRGLTNPGGIFDVLDPRLQTLLFSSTLLAGIFCFIVFQNLSDDDDPTGSLRTALRGPLIAYLSVIAALAAIVVWAVTTDQPVEIANRPGMEPASVLYAFLVRATYAGLLFRTAWWSARLALARVDDRDERTAAAQLATAADGGESAPHTSKPRHELDLPARIGMWMITIGALFVGVSTALNAVFTALLLAGHPPIAWRPFSTTLDAVIGIVGMIGGVLMPVVAGRIQALVRWFRALHQYRSLGPLYHELQALFPEVVLGVDPPRSTMNGTRHADSGVTGPATAASTAAERMEFKATRRVMECFDGLGRLRPHIESGRTADELNTNPALVAAVEQLELDRELAAAVLMGNVGPAIDHDTHRLVAVSKTLRQQRRPRHPSHTGPRETKGPTPA